MVVLQVVKRPNMVIFFMVRRLLGNACKELDDTQRENIFHSRCLIEGKVCSLIIDSGSCTNVVSARLVEKLGMKTSPHPWAYKLQWLSEHGELVVDKQVLISFSIGRYKDDVLCDVVPMETTHLLLGRPWQFDKHAFHDGVENTYSFEHCNRKVLLKPLTPKEVCEDQIFMKNKRESEKKSHGHGERKRHEAVSEMSEKPRELSEKSKKQKAKA